MAALRGRPRPRLDLHAGRPRRPVGAGSGRRCRYLRAAPAPGRARSPADPADVFSEDDRLQWHPSMAGFRDLHAEGKVSVLPAVGYTNADQSHFTLAPLLGGRRDERAQPPSVGWGATSTTTGHRQPAAGTDDRLLAPAVTGHRRTCRSPRSPIPTSSASGWRTAGRGWSTRRIRSSGADGAIRRADDDEVARRASAALRQLGALKDRSARSRACPIPFQAAVTYPSSHPFPARLAMVAEMIAAGCRCVASRCSRLAATTPMPDTIGAMEGSLKLDCDAVYGVPAGPRGSRPRRSRPDPRLERVRPSRAGERPRWLRPWRRGHLVPHRDAASAVR